MPASAWVPSSTYRLQFLPHFPFRDAVRVLPYLRRLGIDAVYASPLLKAAGGSTHGYNGIDPLFVNPEIGSEEDFEAFCDALGENGLKLIIDVVPNHMSAHPDNRYWSDVLEHGKESVYARFFDIDWKPIRRDLTGKVLLPVLAGPYGEMLDRGEIRLTYDDGRFFVETGGMRFPTDPATTRWILGGEIGFDWPKTGFVSRAQRHRRAAAARRALASAVNASPALRRRLDARLSLFNGRPGSPDSFDALHALLERQHYRLADWHVASDEINYRRFFNINELAAVKTEDERVFHCTHAKIARWLHEGRAHGLRIDHPDGLYEPEIYFRRLREIKNVYVVVEKILSQDEPLREDWAVDGTVGYEYLNLLNGLFVDGRSERALEEVYESFIGHPIDFESLVHDAKKRFVTQSMSSEMNVLARRLHRQSSRSRYFRDYTLHDLTQALKETIACFPVYRTYIKRDDRGVAEDDARYIRAAIAEAKRANAGVNPSVFDFVERSLLSNEKPYREFALRFQQLASPVMAKGFEDTALYINHRLLSLNEVGGDPARFGVSPEEFHRRNFVRLQKHPAGLLPSSTHDTKRSEDVRQRLNVLSEIPGEWSAAIAGWARMNERHKTGSDGGPMPRRNTEYFIYQTLAGVWPVETGPDDVFRGRVWACVEKSIREAKIYTDWTKPDAGYEDAVRRFVEALLADRPDNVFLPSFDAFCRRLADLGRLNTLTATVLRLASPGVLDTYQGDEIWNLSLVDPDNRRPVDFALRRELLQAAEGEGPAHVRGLFERRADGRCKLFLLSRGLAGRRADPALFLEGEYQACACEGRLPLHAVGFLRRRGATWLLAAGGRFFASLPGPAGESWRGTWLGLPNDVPEDGWRDFYTGQPRQPRRGERGWIFDLEEVFSCSSATLLIRN